MGRRAFSIYVADAFAERVFGGNQAGVVLLEEGQDFPESTLMCKIAGEMKHSETAFVKRAAGNAFRVRYFTPVEEVALCGHATIAAFGVLYGEGLIGDGSFRLYPGEVGEDQQPLEVTVQQGNVWMDMASPKVERELNPFQALELYEAYGLDGEEELSRLREQGEGLLPAIVNTGLPDIMLPVGSVESLNSAVQDCAKVTEISRRYQGVGVHMFCLSDREQRTGMFADCEKNREQEAGTSADREMDGEQVTAHCRNFAPAVGIDEESATGTANGALTWYLYCKGLLQPRGEHVFLQGEAMGKPSYVKSSLVILSEKPEDRSVIRIGGRAQISLKGQIYVEE